MPSGIQTLSTREALYTAKEAAAKLRRTVKQLHALVRAGRLGCFQVSPKERLFSEDDLQTFLYSIRRSVSS
ncbi:MAG: helix-turn-helix domain-containing protein [Desulfomonile tiedjei]|nr:helix-turn-helix domain-containing protein [Desulfomonile tiedjei]